MGNGDADEELTLWLEKTDFYFEVQSVPEALKYSMLVQVCGDKLHRLLRQQDLDGQVTDEKTKYQVAVDFLKTVYTSERNILSERVNFMAIKRSPGQSVRDYAAILREKVRYCNYQACCVDEFLRDVFCRGLADHFPDTMLAVTRAFSFALSNDQNFNLSQAITAAEVEETAHSAAEIDKKDALVSAASIYSKKDLCWNCGNRKHSKSACPAKDAPCNNCNEVGHFQKCCPKLADQGRPRGRGRGRRQKRFGRRRADGQGQTSSVSAIIGGDRKKVDVSVNGFTRKWLVDTGSHICVVSKDFAKDVNLRWCRPKWLPRAQSASGDQLKLLGYCDVVLECQGHLLPAKVYIASTLTDGAILGSDVLGQFKGLFVKYSGSLDPLTVGSVESADYSWVYREYSDLFDKPSAVWNVPPKPCIKLKEGAKPVAAPSRRFSPDDQKFIKDEVARFLKAGIIEPSRSEWRAQPVIVKTGRKARRLVIDYSTTINRYTVPDAYPFPLVDTVLEEMGDCKYYSVINLSKAYYQVRLAEDERHLTAFEAAGGLYQFTRFSLGLMNAVPCFQREIDEV